MAYRPLLEGPPLPGAASHEPPAVTCGEGFCRGALRLYNFMILISRAYALSIIGILTFTTTLGTMISMCYNIQSGQRYFPWLPNSVLYGAFPALFVLVAIFIDQLFDLWLDTLHHDFVPFTHLRARVMTVVLPWVTEEDQEKRTKKACKRIDALFAALITLVPLGTTFFYMEPGQFYKGEWKGIAWSTFFLVIVYTVSDLLLFFRNLRKQGKDEIGHEFLRTAFRESSMRIGSMGTLWWVLLAVGIRSTMFVQSFVKRYTSYWRSALGLQIVIWSVSIMCAWLRSDMSEEQEQMFKKFYEHAKHCMNLSDLENDASHTRSQAARERDRITCHHKWWYGSLILTLLYLFWGLYASGELSEQDVDPVSMMHIKNFSVIMALLLVVVYAVSLTRELVGGAFYGSLITCLLVTCSFFLLHCGPFQMIQIVSPDSVVPIMQEASRNSFGTHEHGYPVCGLSFGAEEARLSALDLGTLAWYSYAMPEKPSLAQKGIKESFGTSASYSDLSKIDACTVSHPALLRVDFEPSDDVSGRTIVVAIRGTADVKDLDLDTSLYASVKLYQIANSMLVPILSLVPFSFTQELLDLITPNRINEVFNRVSNCVKAIQRTMRSSDKMVLTGHSLGGLFAEVIGVKLGLETLVFSAPGFFMMKKAFAMRNVSNTDLEKYTVIVPRHDPVPKVDLHHGDQQSIQCHAAKAKGIYLMQYFENMACHSIAQTICELESSCGGSSADHLACGIAGDMKTQARKLVT